jgi:Cu/Ag efflux protein CusF
MRKFSLMILSLVLVLGVAGLSMAAETQHAAATTMATTMAKGTVGSVDAQAKSFTIKSKAGEETFKVADKATFKAGYKTIGLADLKAGDWVQVAYDTAGSDKQATKVTVLGAATPKNGK